ncbi:MAG: CUAEP/CCAEP-tail radical SAM protein [Chloroflexi bacterium]|nr:CUAEP/CCAEP-tail radical SAM protein [Chloroflexota bacterium]
MRVLIVSTYELGHQPVHAASPAAALQAAGHEVRALDLAVEMWDPDALDGIDALAFSVPMHTAMRIAVSAAQAARRTHPDVPICFYGLYGEMAPALDPSHPMDRALAGEYEPELVAWVDALPSANGTLSVAPEVIQLGKHDFHAPARELLPPIDRYARLAVDGEERLAGYVEASHGCVHKCRHCPVPVVYDGRIRIVGADTVLDDIARLVDAGARHITFGDPDFLNGWRHSRKVVRAMQARFPELTFDCTTKVEHILEHAHVWPEFADAGCLFVISAFESLNDGILERLDKGHVAAEAEQAITLLRRHGIETRPSWLPFTPWTTFTDVLDILDFVAAHDLVGNVDPVQYGIRLLLPKGSLLLGLPDMQRHLGPYDQAQLSYRWRAADPAVDALQAAIGALVAEMADEDTDIATSYSAVRAAVIDAAGAAADGRARDVLVNAERAAARPRLTEAWFCCAEPTELQFAQLAGI